MGKELHCEVNIVRFFPRRAHPPVLAGQRARNYPKAAILAGASTFPTPAAREPQRHNKTFLIFRDSRLHQNAPSKSHIDVRRTAASSSLSVALSLEPPLPQI